MKSAEETVTLLNVKTVGRGRALHILIIDTSYCFLNIHECVLVFISIILWSTKTFLNFICCFSEMVFYVVYVTDAMQARLLLLCMSVLFSVPASVAFSYTDLGND
jgi:hypothetical protein